MNNLLFMGMRLFHFPCLKTVLPLSLVLALSLCTGISASANAVSISDSGTATDAKAVGTKGPKKVIVIPVENEVDFGLFAFLKRSVAEAKQKKPDIIVFKINTYGGELQSAFDIVDLLTGITQCSTYAYVEQKAISAGALISLASNRIVMGNSTTIGDCAPITQSKEGIVMLGEKIQSPLRAKFRTLAERNGYPSLMAEAMVTTDIGVVSAEPGKKSPADYFTVKGWEALSEAEKGKYQSHKVIVGDGQLLTMTDKEAKTYGFSEGSYASLEDFLKARNWIQTESLETTWSEDLVRVIGKFAPILMLIGFGALYLEFKTPGLSAFGVIGVVCLAIVFGSKYAVGLANYTEFLLLLTGFALFFVEMYLFPGTMIAGAMGVLLVIVALTLSLQTFTIPDPKMPWEFKSLIDNLFMTVGTAVMAIFIPLVAIRYIVPRLAGSAKVISDATLADSRSVAPETTKIAIGLSGHAKTPLRPTGKAGFGDLTLEVSSRGEFINPGQAVEVCQIQGNKIVVRPKEDLT